MTVQFSNRPHFQKLVDLCADLPPLRSAVICPHETASLQGTLDARDAGLIEPVLVGEPDKIHVTAEAIGADIAGLDIVEASGDSLAAHRGVDLVASGEAGALMKGHLHSDVYLEAVVRRENGLRGPSRSSHCFAMDIPGWHKLVIITDAALNVAPNVEQLKSITQNAIDLARALSISEPKVAMLSATEEATDTIPSSQVARAIVEAAKAGEITGGLVDGPFALDNAVNADAAKLKGISSPVAGDADVLVVPGIEAGNIFFKALTFMAGAETAGLVVGTSAPVTLTSRADSAEARIVSSALAVLDHHYRSQQTR